MTAQKAVTFKADDNGVQPVHFAAVILTAFFSAHSGAVACYTRARAAFSQNGGTLCQGDVKGLPRQRFIKIMLSSQSKIVKHEILNFRSSKLGQALFKQTKLFFKPGCVLSCILNNIGRRFINKSLIIKPCHNTLKLLLNTLFFLC